MLWGVGQVYPLAILIAFFSGAWPYIKLACMFVCWLSPTGLLSVKRRESILQFMDMMGKWSLIDFFVMTMFMCAFYFELALVPQVGARPISIKLTITASCTQPHAH